MVCLCYTLSLLSTSLTTILHSLVIALKALILNHDSVAVEKYQISTSFVQTTEEDGKKNRNYRESVISLIAARTVHHVVVFN